MLQFRDAVCLFGHMRPQRAVLSAKSVVLLAKPLDLDAQDHFHGWRVSHG